jgi:hypothetical protein
MKLWRLPKITPLWAMYNRWKENNFCQNVWDKSEVLWRTCWGHIGNLGNLMRIHWELKGNIVGTHWELGKNEKKIFPPSPPPPQNQKSKGKKERHLECMLGPSHWLVWNFSSQKSSSPFLAWTNTLCKEHTWETHWEPDGINWEL